MTDVIRCRALLAEEMIRGVEQGEPDIVILMVRDGRMDDTVEMAALIEAVAIGARASTPKDQRIGVARSLLAAAFGALVTDRGGCMLSAGCVRAIRRGDWDDLPLLRAIRRALGGERIA